MYKNRISISMNRTRWATLVVLTTLLVASLLGGTYAAMASGPFVQIVKTGPATANPGDHIMFTLTIGTYATGVATHVVVWDDLYYASLDRYEIFRREMTPDELATLNAGGAVVIEVPYQVPCDAGGHVLDNDAYAEATFADGTTRFATNDHDVVVPRPDEVDCTPAIDLEKRVNGQDADTPMEAVVVNVGAPLTFKYIVTNTGDAAFFDIEVTDDNETPGDMTDDITIGTIHSLAPGQSKTFTRQAVAEAGLHTDVGTVCGRPSTTSGCEPPVCDDDAANYSAPVGPGVGTPGYWKNHPEAWPVEEITIGGVTHTKDEAIGYMKMEVKNDKTYTMFPALVAARLNVLIGNEDWCIADTIAADDDWMATYGPVGSGVKAGGKDSPWREGEPLYKALDKYNNGDLPCAISRDDLE
jgi:hypothetical protein